MATLDISKYGINDVREIVYNPSFEQLFKDEIDNLIKKIHVLVDTESQDKWSRGKSSIPSARS